MSCKCQLWCPLEENGLKQLRNLQDLVTFATFALNRFNVWQNRSLEKFDKQWTHNEIKVSKKSFICTALYKAALIQFLLAKKNIYAWYNVNNRNIKNNSNFTKNHKYKITNLCNTAILWRTTKKYVSLVFKTQKLVDR